MKKQFFVFIIALLLMVGICACGIIAENQTNTPITTIEAASTQAPVTFTSGRQIYIVTYEIRQSHFSLDISDWIKDDLNAITIDIPVDEEYYNSLTIGQIIKDDFRMGSLIMKGSYGNWEISVFNKRIEVIQ